MLELYWCCCCCLLILAILKFLFSIGPLLLPLVLLACLFRFKDEDAEVVRAIDCLLTILVLLALEGDEFWLEFVGEFVAKFNEGLLLLSLLMVVVVELICCRFPVEILIKNDLNFFYISKNLKKSSYFNIDHYPR